MLEYTPTIKRKRGAHLKQLVEPFPRCPDIDKTFTGVFTGISVEICDQQEMQTVYECGCFGKGSQSRSAPHVVRPPKEQVEKRSTSEESLSLDLEESFFLAHYLKVLRIVDLDGIHMGWHQLLDCFTQLKTNFVECFVGYLYLKSKNWVVKSGTKFGGDFLIYKKGLRFYHASFIVLISRPDSSAMRSPKDIKGLQRIAETSDKDVLLLEVMGPTQDAQMNSPDEFKSYTVSETIIRRFNYTAFVQSQNSTK